jgi:hypothetical protein
MDNINEFLKVSFFNGTELGASHQVPNYMKNDKIIKETT